MTNLGQRVKAIQDDPGGLDDPKPQRHAVVQSLADIEARELEWLWRGWIPRGMLTMFGGYAGDGKSTIMSALAAAFSTGARLPDGTPAPLTNSLFLTAEEDPQFALKPRLTLHGADHARIFIMRGTRDDGDGGTPRWTHLTRDLPMIRTIIGTHAIGMLCLDTISSYLSGADRNSEGDIRDGLSGLQALMEDTGVAVVGIGHVGKGDGAGRRPEQRLLGSTAFSALARSVLMLTNLPDDLQPDHDPDNPADKRKVFGVAKANYSIPPQSLIFARPLDGPIQWLGPSPVSITEAFASMADRGSKSRDAEEWLREHLAGGSKPTRSVNAAARDAGIAFAAVKRARGALNITARKEPSGEWVLSLPPRLTTPETEGLHDLPATGHVSAMNALHNTSESKEFIVNPLNPFPEYQGKWGVGEGSEQGTEHGTLCKAFNSPLKGPVEPLPPTGADDGSLAALSDHDRADVLEMIHELVVGGPQAVASWRAELTDPKVPDLDRRLGQLAASLAEQQLAREAA